MSNKIAIGLGLGLGLPSVLMALGACWFSTARAGFPQRALDSEHGADERWTI